MASSDEESEKIMSISIEEARQIEREEFLSESDEEGCECCDSLAEHEAYLAKQAVYWESYFGKAVSRHVQAERELRNEGINASSSPSSPEGQYEIQHRLK